MDFDFAGDGKSRIKTQTKMTNNIVIFIAKLMHEFRGAGKGHLIDVFFDFISGHANAVINNREGFGLFVDFDLNFEFGLCFFGLANYGQMAQLRNGINAIGDQFAQKDLLVVIEPFFDNRKNIFHLHGDGSRFKRRKNFGIAHGLPPRVIENVLYLGAGVLTPIRHISRKPAKD